LTVREEHGLRLFIEESVLGKILEPRGRKKQDAVK